MIDAAPFLPHEWEGGVGGGRLVQGEVSGGGSGPCVPSGPGMQRVR